MASMTGLAPHNFNHVLWLDYETFSEADIKKVGAYVYATHPSTHVIMAQWALDEGPVQIVSPLKDGREGLTILVELIKRPDVLVVAHNAPFERLITAKEFNYRIPIERLRCAMIQALSNALPGSLDAICKALPIPEHLKKLGKDRSQALINKFCKPAPKSRKVDRYDHITDPSDWLEFENYGRLDVEALRAIVRLMPNVNIRNDEQKLWELDRQFNDHGIAIDIEFLDAAIQAAARYKQRLVDEFHEIQRTLGLDTVLNPSQRAKVGDMYLSLGVDVPDSKKATLERYIREHPDMDESIKRLMEIQFASNKNSVSKYQALKPMIGRDGRFRGGLQFNGAARTRRWAGRGLQPQNLPSRGIPDNDVILEFVRRVKAGESTADMGDQVMLVSAAIRSLLIVAKGKRMVVADLSNIEGRFAAWVSGEDWKIKAFEEYDAGTGPDLYCIGAVSIIGGDPWTVDKKIRNVLGKVPELAFGYQAGVMGGQQFACDFGIRMQDYMDVLTENVDAALITQAHANWERFGKSQERFEQRIDMTPDEWHDEWIATEISKLSWRKRHPAIVQMWYDLEQAATNAIQFPNNYYKAGDKVKFICTTLNGIEWLLMRLPSGKYVMYMEPKVEGGQITYWGKHPKTAQWVRLQIHGGKFLGNVCQSGSRDIMAGNMPQMAAEGWQLLLTVHDEVVAERDDDDQFDGQRFADLLAMQPAWAKGLPLSAPADDHVIYRYGKY